MPLQMSSVRDAASTMVDLVKYTVSKAIFLGILYVVALAFWHLELNVSLTPLSVQKSPDSWTLRILNDTKR